MQFTDNYPLKNVTTLQIGGPAKKFAAVQSAKELIEAIDYANKEKMPYLVIGEGSNLLISDKGLDGLVIKNEITGISHPRGVIVKVRSGTRLQELVDFAVANGLAGLQRLTGIPGTVGGAVYGNAGAYGQTISDHIVDVVVIPREMGIYTNNMDPRFHHKGATYFPPRGLATMWWRVGSRGDDKKRVRIIKEECCFSYRSSIFKQTKQPILEATFQLEPADPEILQKEAEDVLSKRSVKYPPGLKCPGSFFKNLVAADLPAKVLKNIPPEKIVYGKIPAGALLEEVGAQGQCLDGIEIASYHANLFLNQGNGTAKAFYDLAKTYAKKVWEKYGVTLEPEVQLINLPPLN